MQTRSKANMENLESSSHFYHSNSSTDNTGVDGCLPVSEKGAGSQTMQKIDC